MNKLKLFILSIACILNLSSARNYSSDITEHYFALGIIANPTGNDPLISFAIVTMKDGKMVASQPITKNTFIRMACGDWPSKANPGQEDLFLKHDILSCGRFVDTMSNTKIYLCDALDSLWKVRFKEHPYVFDDSGWSRGRLHPNKKQIEFLYKEYEVARINLDFFIGNFMWKLLKDVQDPKWIEHYKSLEDIK